MLEFKRRNDGNNVVFAVAAMANTDGGLVVVGVDESAEDPFMGIERSRHDSIVASLRALVPSAMPEVIPLAIPDRDRLITVFRVDAELAERPVVVDGRIMKRVPGHSVGARRDEVIALCVERSAMVPSGIGGAAPELFDALLWEPPPGTSEIRARRASYLLPRSLARRRQFFGTAAIAAAEQHLNNSPVPVRLLDSLPSASAIRASRWRRTHTASARVDFSAETSSAAHDWRPEIHAFFAVNAVVSTR